MICVQRPKKSVTHSCAGPEGSKTAVRGGDFILFTLKHSIQHAFISAYVPNTVLVHLVGQKAIEVRKGPEPSFTPLGQFQPWTRQEQPCLRTSSLLVRPHAFHPAPLPLKHFLALLPIVFPRWETEGWLRLSGHREGHS